MKLIQYKALFAAAIVAATAPACRKFVQVSPPGNSLSSTLVFSSDQTATAAISGLYLSLDGTGPATALNGYSSVYPGLSADEIIRSRASTTDGPFQNNAIPSNSSVITGFWNLLYNDIYTSNAIIAGLKTANGVTPALASQLDGEAKFVRAYCYFYLVNLFGDVPLETTTSYTTNEVMGRTASAKVYQQMVQDLEDASNECSATYPGDGTKIRVNKWAATAMLAKVYLYEGDWTDAKTQAALVLNSGAYSLDPSLTNVFQPTTSEAIWELQPSSEYFNTGDGYMFVPYSSSAIPNYEVTTNLLASFETGDQRPGAWINTVTVGTTTYSYPYKYEVRSTTSLVENLMILRLAEQYLIRAEAEAEGNDITDAVTDINYVRVRAGVQPLLPTISQADLLTAIQHERQVEFCFEQGARWFDLKRTGTANTILGTEKPGWSASDTLYPLPYAQVLANVNLTQNAGYQ